LPATLLPDLVLFLSGMLILHCLIAHALTIKPVRHVIVDQSSPAPTAFDQPDRLFEAKFDGFRAAADIVRGHLISRNGNRMKRFEKVLGLLLARLVLDGEHIVLDDAGRLLFKERMLGNRPPTYVAFDLLIVDCVDLQPLPLRERKARLAQIAKRPRAWIALTCLRQCRI